jgi:hypothetical protein
MQRVWNKRLSNEQDSAIKLEERRIQMQSLEKQLESSLDDKKRV